MSIFYFYRTDDRPDQSTRIVDVPAGITNKIELFSELSKKLCLPGYFGWNWDSLDECLADLSWIDDAAVLLWHQDIPLRGRPEEAQIYIDLLKQIALQSGKRKLYTYFPESERVQLEALIANL